MIYRTLRAEELPAWYAHCESVFVSETTGYFERHFTMDPDADPSLIFVAMDGDTIAATVRVFRRTIWLHGRAVPMGGIGEVSTKPEYRRRGLVTELMQMAIAAMMAREMPVSILFGDQPLYERAGWRFCQTSQSELPVKALSERAVDGEVRPFEMSELPYVMGMYDLCAGQMDGAILRSEAYWRQWVLPQWAPPQVLVSEDGQPVAYASCEISVQDKTLRVLEMAANPVVQDALPALLARIAQAEGCDHIRYRTPLLRAVHGAAVTVHNGMMVRLNLPLGEITDTDALVEGMRNAGMCVVDHF